MMIGQLNLGENRPDQSSQTIWGDAISIDTYPVFSIMFSDL